GGAVCGVDVQGALVATRRQALVHLDRALVPGVGEGATPPVGGANRHRALVPRVGAGGDRDGWLVAVFDPVVGDAGGPAVVVEAAQGGGVVGKARRRVGGLGHVVGAGVHGLLFGRAVGADQGLGGGLRSALGGADVQGHVALGARPALDELDRALVPGVGEGATPPVGGANRHRALVPRVGAGGDRDGWLVAVFDPVVGDAGGPAVVVEAAQGGGVVGKARRRVGGLGHVVGAGVHGLLFGRAVGADQGLGGGLRSALGGADVQGHVALGARPALDELDRALVPGVGEGAHHDVGRADRHRGLVHRVGAGGDRDGWLVAVFDPVVGDAGGPAVVVEAAQGGGVVGKARRRVGGLGHVVGAGVHGLLIGRAVGADQGLGGGLRSALGGADVQGHVALGARPALDELDRALVPGVGEGAHHHVGGANRHRALVHRVGA